MSNSVFKDKHGPDWPLGYINVPTPGTPVGIMSLVDPSSLDAPTNATASGVAEYTNRCQQIMIGGFKPGASHGMVSNTGNVYLVRKGPGSSNRDDTGAIVTIIQPGQLIFIASAPSVEDVFSPYRYFLDADNAGEGALVTLFIF